MKQTRSYNFFRGGPTALVEYTVREGDSYSATYRVFLRTRHRWRDVTPKPLPAGWVDDIFFLDERRGWLVASDCAAAKGAIYATTDRGRSWRRISTGWTRTCAAGAGLDLAFADRRRGWILHPEPTAPAMSVHRTTDGGRTWRGGRLEDREPVLDEALLASAQVGWGVSFLWSDRALFTTGDGGFHWTRAGLPRTERHSIPVLFGRVGLAMTTSGTRATVHRTSDSGRRWRTAASVETGRMRFASFRASSPTNWWIAGVRGVRPVVFETADAGRTWRRSQPARKGWWVDLEPDGPARAFLNVTKQGGRSFLLRTTDGARWTDVSPPDAPR